MGFRKTIAISCFLVLGCIANVGRGEDAGQADLDQAVDAQVEARTESDLAEVIRHCESALEKGLSDENKKFANQLLASTLTVRGEMYAGQIFNPPGDPRWSRLRDAAVGDLDRAISLGGTAARTYFTLGRLRALPGGDRDKAREALGEAIKLQDEDQRITLRAFVLRAELTEDAEKRLADLNAAVELDPQDVEVRQARGAYFFEQQKFAEAIADFSAAIEQAPEDPRSYHARGLAHLLSQQFDDALASFNKAVELAPDNANYLTQRARVHTLKGDAKAAIADLDKAIGIDPTDVGALLLRATNRSQSQQDDLALSDIDEALKAQPDSAPAMQMRGMLLARMNKMDEAIAALEQVRSQQPDDLTNLTQLGVLYSVNKQAEKAIETFTQVLSKDAKNATALQARADALLTIGKHAEAIADYDVALEIAPKDSGLLNNLAWVLATSPDDKLRDPKRALELALRACDVTEYKQAHILSTLAAAYAEGGDFSKAVEWSAKAVEMSDEKLRDPLTKELKSYQARKPWREFRTGEARSAE